MTSLLSRIFRAQAEGRPPDLHRLHPRPVLLLPQGHRPAQGQQRRHGFRIEEVDIDSDPELVAKYAPRSPSCRWAGKCGSGAS